MKKLMLVALLVFTMGCAIKKPCEPIRIPYPVYVPIADCDNIQLLKSATDVCIADATVEHVGVNGLCQYAIDYKKLNTCKKNLSETLGQEILDCQEANAKAKAIMDGK